jgi:hypothetical protein
MNRRDSYQRDLFSVWSVLRNNRTVFSVLSVPWLYNTSPLAVKEEVIQNHDNENVRNIGQGEARHRKYKRLKLGGGQAYDRSSD